MSVGMIATSLKVSPPTVRSRIEALLEAGILKVVGLINPFKAKELTIAIIGISLEMHKDLDKKIEEISNLEQVHWAAAVTGRYDIIVELVLTEGMSELYRFLTESLPQVGGIHSSESFMVMKADRKWILFPEHADS